MAIRPLQRNAIFLAGSVLAGLVTALLLNRLWPQDDGVAVAPVTAAPPAADAAGAPLVAPTMVAAQADDAPGSDAAVPGSSPAANDMDAQVVPTGSYSAAVRRSAPAVVSIYTQTKVPVGPPVLQRTPSGQLRLAQREGLQPALGSGVIVDAKGHIVTNDHVIRGADQIKVQLADGRVADATILGRDPETDLAVLKIDLPRLPVMTLGRSDRLKVGDVVLAIGNPLGLSQTVTHGIVSFTGRAGFSVATYEDFIQTDAAINAGNSGGALVNARGELIGINTAVLEGADGLGLAIPVDLVRGVTSDILLHGHVLRGWIGIGLKDVSEAEARQREFPYAGVLVWQFDPRSPALQPGGLALLDKIETIDGQDARTAQDTMARIANRKPGTSVKITGMRCVSRSTTTCRGQQPFSSTVTVIQPPPLTK